MFWATFLKIWNPPNKTLLNTSLLSFVHILCTFWSIEHTNILSCDCTIQGYRLSPDTAVFFVAKTRALTPKSTPLMTDRNGNRRQNKYDNDPSGTGNLWWTIINHFRVRISLHVCPRRHSIRAETRHFPTTFRYPRGNHIPSSTGRLLILGSRCGKIFG